MTTAHEPEGSNSVSPYLIVEASNKTFAFLQRVFGADELRRFPDERGKLLHSEVRIDDMVVMTADGGNRWIPMPAHVHLYVRDVDATYTRAIEAGAESAQAPVKGDDDDKRGPSCVTARWRT